MKGDFPRGREEGGGEKDRKGSKRLLQAVTDNLRRGSRQLLKISGNKKKGEDVGKGEFHSLTSDFVLFYCSIKRGLLTFSNGRLS